MPKLLQQIMGALERGQRFVTRDVWRIGRPGEEVPHGLIIKQVRAAILLMQGMVEETFLLRASALTFATLLFIVPFLVFMFYFIQTFNLGDQVYERMDAELIQVVAWVRGVETGELEGETSVLGGEEKTEAKAEAKAEANNRRLQQQIVGAIFPIFSSDAHLADESVYQNPIKLVADLAQQGATNPQAITLTGLLFVLSTVFGFMRNVESAFNGIWGVRRTRSPFRTISDYMMVTLLLPFVAAVVLGVTAALENDYVAEILGPLAIGLRGAQFLMICLTFTMLYYFVPNARVRIRYALMGGLVAGALWVLCSWGYIKFQVGLTRYALFFSGFALFPLLLMWLFLSWLILLSGALLTFAYQNEKTFAMERFADDASYAYREALAVRIVLEMARRFRRGQAALSVAEAAGAWNVPTRLLNETLDCLAAAKLASECATEPVTYLPARSPDTTTLLDIAHAMREEGRDPSLLRQDHEYRSLYQSLEGADGDVLSATVTELVMRLDQDQ